ncbi:MAG: uridine kinase [Candidatus Nanohaloarchaea archaeon]|nr:uridine kinase [Candidatus Nanohaloarchaea archaeon]
MIVVGVAGGSGSGKTYMSSAIRDRLPGRTLLLSMDDYYRPFSDRSRFERMQINFDRPDTFDWELLKSHLQQLRAGEPIEKPVYSFEESTRVDTEHCEPAEVVVLEGIYALYDDDLNEMMDLRVFLDPDPDVRAVRRLKRDVTERDRNIEFAAKQYLEKTKKMHEEHVEPTKEEADVVLDAPEADRFVEMVTELLEEHQPGGTDLRRFVAEEF